MYEENVAKVNDPMTPLHGRPPHDLLACSSDIVIILPTSLVVRVVQSRRCVCVSLFLRQISNELDRAIHLDPE